MTLRDLIRECVQELSKIDQIGPGRASEILVKLSSLLASITKECVEARHILSVKKVELLKEHGTATSATIYVEASPEFKEWAERDGLRKDVIEQMRAIKFYIKASVEEYKGTVS